MRDRSPRQCPYGRSIRPRCGVMLYSWRRSGSADFWSFILSWPLRMRVVSHLHPRPINALRTLWRQNWTYLPLRRQNGPCAGPNTNFIPVLISQARCWPGNSILRGNPINRFNRLPTGGCTSNPQQIVSRFSDFLSRLYAKPDPFPVAQAEAFFQDLRLPGLSEAAQVALNDGVTVPEVLQAIKSLRSTAAPRPDGFSGLYYKKFSAILAPFLAEYFNALQQGSSPSPDALRTHIAMIPKTTDDVQEPQAFRPISLLNEDLKILGKILSFRINKYLRSLVHRDQVGFVPGRQAGD
ncbi:unnamed protein product, partial [Staurois parvus]